MSRWTRWPHAPRRSEGTTGRRAQPRPVLHLPRLKVHNVHNVHNVHIVGTPQPQMHLGGVTQVDHPGGGSAGAAAPALHGPAVGRNADGDRSGAPKNDALTAKARTHACRSLSTLQRTPSSGGSGAASLRPGGGWALTALMGPRSGFEVPVGACGPVTWGCGSDPKGTRLAGWRGGRSMRTVPRGGP